MLKSYEEFDEKHNVEILHNFDQNFASSDPFLLRIFPMSLCIGVDHLGTLICWFDWKHFENGFTLSLHSLWNMAFCRSWVFPHKLTEYSPWLCWCSARGRSGSSDGAFCEMYKVCHQRSWQSASSVHYQVERVDANLPVINVIIIQNFTTLCLHYIVHRCQAHRTLLWTASLKKKCVVGVRRSPQPKIDRSSPYRTRLCLFLSHFAQTANLVMCTVCEVALPIRRLPECIAYPCGLQYLRTKENMVFGDVQRAQLQQNWYCYRCRGGGLWKVLHLRISRSELAAAVSEKRLITSDFTFKTTQI